MSLPPLQLLSLSLSLMIAAISVRLTKSSERPKGVSWPEQRRRAAPKERARPTEGAPIRSALRGFMAARSAIVSGALSAPLSGGQVAGDEPLGRSQVSSGPGWLSCAGDIG